MSNYGESNDNDSDDDYVILTYIRNLLSLVVFLIFEYSVFNMFIILYIVICSFIFRYIVNI